MPPFRALALIAVALCCALLAIVTWLIVVSGSWLG